MKKKDLDKLKVPTEQEDVEMLPTALESIIWHIHDSLNKTYNEKITEEGNALLCEDLLECLDLAYKILTYDYFKKSEAYLDSVSISKDNYNAFTKISRKWDRMYKKELKEKKADLKRLFKLILQNAEEI